MTSSVLVFGLAILNTVFIILVPGHLTDEYYATANDGKPFCNATVRQDASFLYKCMCDSNCSVYGDCCSDSLFYNVSRKSDVNFSCNNKFQYYIVDTCPASFQDVAVRVKCENSSLHHCHEDAKVMKPVMDKISRITYRNAYCALCHDVADFDSFNVSYQCRKDDLTKNNTSITDEQHFVSVLLNATFSSGKKCFTSTLNEVDYVCTQDIVIPEYLESHLRYCELDIISTCPSTYNNSAIVEKCALSNFIVNSSADCTKKYKNEFCARCNDVQADFSLRCLTQYPSPLPEDLSLRLGASSLFDSSFGKVTCADPRLSRFC